MNIYSLANFSESITDLFPLISKHIQFDRYQDHEDDESIYNLKVGGESYDLRQCSLCKEILFVRKIKK